MNKAIGLRDPLLLPPEERVVRNHWVTDVYSKALGFGDMGVLEFAAIEKHTNPYGVLLLIEEARGGVLQLSNTAAQHREATHEQLEVVEELAALDPNSDIPQPLKDRAQETVPALYLARIAVINKDVLFHAASGVRERFEELLPPPDEQPSRLAKPETRELYEHAWSLSTTSLTPAAFVINVARHAQRA